MRVFLTRFLLASLALITAIAFSSLTFSQIVSGDSVKEESSISMGAVLDLFLSPKAIDTIEPLSQWNGKYVITPDNAFPLPQPLVPFYCDVSGVPDPDDFVFYVANEMSSPAFDSVDHEGLTYNYWESDTYPYVGPLDPSTLPYSITLPLDTIQQVPPQIIEVNALTGLWGSNSIYMIGDAYRIYYNVKSVNPASLYAGIWTDSDLDVNAVPDDIRWVGADSNIWFGASTHRSATGANLNFADENQVPGQAKGTLRLIPQPGILVDMPITDAFYDTGLATTSEQVIAMIQVANSIYESADIQQAGQKSRLDAMPGAPLIEDAFVSLHYFKGEGSLEPVQEITPLATTLTIQNVPLLEAASVLYERLALWRYPLTLDATTGQYADPVDGEYALAHAADIRLTEGTFSATVAQDGILVPLVTKLWVDDPFPYVLAANTEKPQPLVLKGFFPTWMGAVPESGVLAAEAALHYAVTTTEDDLTFRMPENDIDGFDESYAISPVTNAQTPNEAYLWLPAELPANDNTLIRVSYTTADAEVVVSDVTVTVAETAHVSVSATTNVPATPLPARVFISPEQSEVALPAGAYLLETGRFFTDETIEVSVEVDEGWGLVRWLQNGEEVATTAIYSFSPTSDDTTMAAEVASYALDLSVSPVVEWGEITVTPAPVSGTPGYAPGTEVFIEATPLSGSLFESWMGADASQLIIDPATPNRASILMDGDKAIAASFRKEVALSAAVLPIGTGTLSYRIGEEDAVAFPVSGTLLVDMDTTVTLLGESLSEEYRLKEWLLDDVPAVAEADGSLAVVMDADKAVTAMFGRIVELTLDDSPDGTIELVSPEPVGCTAKTGKTIAHCFWENTDVILRAVALSPESHILNSWWINGVEYDGTTPGFAAEYTIAISNDTTVRADFRRQLRVDGLSLAAVPLNRAVPLTLTGVFPTWMGSTEKASPSLTADEAEVTYEILIGGTPASFIAPEDTPFTPAGEGVTALDEADVEATNATYIWSPELLELPADLTEIPVSISNRINPLNAFEILLPLEVFVNVVSLSVEALPENTSGIVLTVPEQGTIPGVEGDSLPLSPGEYMVGDVVSLSAVPGYSLIKYQITTAAGVQEITTPEHDLTITEDTQVLAIFETEAYELTLVESENGVIAAEPPSSPGWPLGWYEMDTEVVLTSTANAGYRSVFWTHDLAGESANPITIIMDRDKQVGALYLMPDRVAINVITGEGGTVVLQPVGNSDETNPTVFLYDADTDLRLIGQPNPNFRFDSWRIQDALGDRSILDNPLDLTLSQDYTVEPKFNQTYKLDLSVLPEDSGEILATPPEPTAGYDLDTVVTITAVPAEDSDYKFIQWTGANVGEIIPNSTTATITVVMDSNKQLGARFSKFVVASIEPEETWIIGGIVAKITGEAITDATVVRFGEQDAAVFDVAPSGQYAFVRVPPLSNPGDEDSIKVALDVINDDLVTPYAPGFTYLQRTENNNLYTTAFVAEQAGVETSVFVARIGGKDANVTIPPLGESPVYGIIRMALPGQLGASRTGVTESIPGTAAGGLYDVGIHLYMTRIGVADVPQFGVMSYEDMTHDLLAFARPYRTVDASPATLSESALINMAVQTDAGPTYAAIRNGFSLWGVATNYDYLYNAETVIEVLPAYQSSLQNEDVLPANEPTTLDTDAIRAIANARIYGGEEDRPANCFTWRSGAVLPVTEQKAIKITAINNRPVSGTGSGDIAGDDALTLTSPYGGIAWIESIELAGVLPTTGGKVAARDLVSPQGENEFLLEFKTPKSARPGMTSIIITTKANPEQPIVLQNVFEYTRAPIRWWLVLLILLGLMFSVIGMATGF